MTEPVLDPHDDVRLALGSYVLGALTPAEREVIDEHVLGCPACAAELDALTAMPLLLDLVSREEIQAMGTGGSAADPALIDRVVSAALAERRQARTRRWLVAAAAAVVLVAGSSVAGVALSGSSSKATTTQAIQFQATDASTHAWAQIGVEQKLWGASLSLKLNGVPAGEHCKLVAVGRDGTTDVAASWEATYKGSATLTGATSLQLSSTAAYDIVTFDGKRLLHVSTQ